MAYTIIYFADETFVSDCEEAMDAFAQVMKALDLDPELVEYNEDECVVSYDGQEVTILYCEGLTSV